MATPETEKPARGTLVHDPELRAMNRILRAVEGLEPPQRERVIRWAIERLQQDRAQADLPLR